MTTTYDELAELWVCTDCMMAAETGEDQPDADREPWNLIPEGRTVTNWGYDPDDVPEGETDGRREFSWAECDGCGSTLGGYRERYALWPDNA